MRPGASRSPEPHVRTVVKLLPSPDRKTRGRAARALAARARLAAWLVTCTLATACTPVGGARPTRTVPEDADPPISSGSTSAGADSAAFALLARAQSALATGRPEDALQAAAEVVDRYATARTSSLALVLLARASLETGAHAEAVAAADRYAGLFAATDARATQGALLAARGLHAMGDAPGAARRLLTLPPAGSAGPDAATLELMRRVARDLSNESLATLVAEAGRRPLATPLVAEHALAVYFQGDVDQARALAADLTSMGARGPEEALARAIATDRVEEVRGALPVIGAMLAETGSPGLTEFSALVREGIDVALRAHGEENRRPVRLRVMDDRGSPAGADAVVRRLEDEGALGVVGPLLNQSLTVAAPARLRQTVLISPTARSLPADATGVYSLAGPDPGAAEALAEYVRAQRFARVVVLRPATGGALEEAQAFREALQEFGLGLVREMAYDSGATFFQEPLEEIAALMPDALVLPLPARDVELLAPQITFFGLDTLGIQVLGTAGWVSEAVVSAVDPRHTTGVVAAAATIPGAPSEGEEQFVREYEAQMRRTLRSRAPALGHDAAALLLHAIRSSGARTAEDVIRGLEQIRAFPGATGTLSIRDGRIVRHHRLVRFEEGMPIPLVPEGGT